MSTYIGNHNIYVNMGTQVYTHNYNYYIIESVNSIIDSVDSISRDEPDSPLTQYITNAGIPRARYTIF